MRALISVYDKTGIVEFTQGLVDLGWEILSTGGTQKCLEEAGIAVTPVEDVTSYPDMLGGRVKTLHPAIHGGILFKRDNEEHRQTLAEHDIQSIDMVVNSLYPFEETVAKVDATHADIIEKIDVGGPSMIRAAAKNYQDVTIIVEQTDYDWVLSRLQENGSLSLAERQTLAGKAFNLTAYYDAQIAAYFNRTNEVAFPEYLTLAYKAPQSLRYGENPHQQAAYYSSSQKKYNFKQLHGKELSYNNLNDLKACLDLLLEFEEPTAVAVKHANPCGVAIGATLAEAYQKAHDCDPNSIFGGIIGLNRPVDLETAQLLSKTFLEIVAAPEFSEEALAVLQAKKNIRLLEIPTLGDIKPNNLQFKETVDGLLLQETDRELFEKWELMTERAITEEEKQDLIFAWKVCKHIASNAMVVAKNGQTYGLGHGEVKRVWALEKSLERSEFPLEGAVVASDAFFFKDTIDTLVDYGIKVIIQPGGSVKDAEVIEAANQQDISVIFTGMRHFKH